MYCETEFLVKNNAHAKRRKTCSNECFQNNLTKRFITFNKSEETRAVRSKTMKAKYSSGEIVNNKGGRAKWFKYKNLSVQGEFEFEMCKSLDILENENLIYKWEYTNDRFPYLKMGKEMATYLLDFKVFLTENIYFYIETKGFPVINDMYKWKTVSQSESLKVFFQKTELENIQKDPKYILKKKSVSRKDIEIEISKMSSIENEVDRMINEIPF